MYNYLMTFRKIRLVLVPIALALAGIGAYSSPAGKIILKNARLAHLSGGIYYVGPEQFKTVQFPPPPAPDSAAQKEDLAAILAWQKKRTKADCAKADITAGLTYDSFWATDMIFPQPLPDEVKKFFDRLSSDLESAVTNMKNRYRRARPYKAYPGLAAPCINKSRGYSYPSGHAVFSRVFADVLTDIVPERKAGFFVIADEIARDRVIGGVHFPTDIAAGKVFADMYHAELLKSPAYRKDLERVKTFLVKQQKPDK